MKREPTLSEIEKRQAAAERLDIASRLLLASELCGRRGGRNIEHGKIRIAREPALGDAQGVLVPAREVIGDRQIEDVVRLEHGIEFQRQLERIDRSGDFDPRRIAIAPHTAKALASLGLISIARLSAFCA